MASRELIALVFCCTGCIAGPVAEYESLPADCSLWDVESDLFHQRCIDGPCHGAVQFPAAGLDLETPGVRDRIVGAPSNGCRRAVLVEPGDETGGVFMDKLTDDPPCGLQMPLGKRKLTEPEFACVLEWTADAAMEAQ